MLDFMVVADLVRQNTHASVHGAPAKEKGRKRLKRRERAGGPDGARTVWGKTISPSPTDARGF